jgi:hypothetical protein
MLTVAWLYGKNPQSPILRQTKILCQEEPTMEPSRIEEFLERLIAQDEEHFRRLTAHNAEPRPPHKVALISVQGLLAIVAGLGITNALREVFYRIASVGVGNANPIRQFTPLLPSWLSCPPSCTVQNLGVGYFSIIITILEIIIAFRFYQSSSIMIEDEMRLPYFGVHSAVFIIEGILTAANSFYIHYPVDFVILLGILLLSDGVFQIIMYLSTSMRPSFSRRRRFWNGVNLLTGFVLLVWYVMFSRQWIVSSDRFFGVAASIIGLSSVIVLGVLWREYFPLPPTTGQAPTTGQ